MSFVKIVSFLAVAFTLGATAPALAQSPSATGTVRHLNNAPMMTFEAFEAPSVTLGFFLRFTRPNGNILTVTPFEMTADGTINFWYIEYWLVGAAQPNGTQGWQWVEVGGGRMSLSTAAATATSIDGTLTATWEKVGYTKVDILIPQPIGVRLTVP